MTTYDDAKIKFAISKTGFVLENEIRTILRDNGWNVIQNRYYVDDVQGTEREIDIVAYKTHLSDEIVFYTSIIISCKKDNENYWTFIHSDDNGKDPNTEYFPLHYGTRDSRLKLMIEQGKSQILKKYTSNPKLNHYFSNKLRVNAFQRICKKNYTPQNDKPIYESIITLIKSVEAEKKSIYSSEKALKRFYSFYLLSVFDGEIVGIDLDTKTTRDLDNINYVNRHIINRTENYYRVRFVTKSYFNNNINQLDEIYCTDSQTYPALIGAFYKDIFSHRDRVSLFWSDFERSVLYYLNYVIEKRVSDVDDKLKGLNYTWNKKSSQLEIELSTENHEDVDKIITVFNNDGDLKKHIAKKLKDIFRYKGGFIFSDDLPF